MENKSIAGAFPPGEYIVAEMNARDWARVDLAEKMGLSPILLDKLIAGQMSVVPVIAHALAGAFGSNASEWLRLQKAYDAARAEGEK